MGQEKPEEFYVRLKEQLKRTTSWPSSYLYKFIVLSGTDKINKIHTIFDNTGAIIETKQSKKGKYTSISITLNLEGPDAVIEKYKAVGAIEGVISL